MTMGRSLSLMQRDLTLIDTDSARDARETLDRLEDMARDRFDLLYEKICYSGRDEHRIHMNKAHVRNKYTYIGVAAGGDNLVWMGEVREAVEEFSVGPFADGLSSVATSTILKMIRVNTGRCQTQQRFAISLNALGGVSRLDYFMFTYTFGCTELARRKASLIACCVVESSAAVKDIDANTLRVIISRVFGGRDTPHFVLTAIYNQPRGSHLPKKRKRVRRTGMGQSTGSCQPAVLPAAETLLLSYRFYRSSSLLSLSCENLWR